MSYTFTENDYKILRAILNKNDRSKGLSKINGTSVKEISEKTNLTDRKIRYAIIKLKESGFITDALADGKIRKYMMTEKGFTEIMNLNRNIAGEV